jgi:FAD/FMN-containing dehydrogenase/Fe-S oxidoreductase
MSLVLTDLPTRRLYASDASMYEELPTGVAFPRSAGEVRALVLEARERGLPLTPRAAGTSLAGQATGSGVIVDVSRHLTRILSLDPDARLARVEPGVIRDTLNREAARYGLQFGPDTSTTNRCMIGGMIGNNSCGSFSIRHGSTRDHVVEIEAVLSDGSAVVFGPLTPEELEERCRRGTLEGAIYRGILSLLEGHRQTILEASPHPEVRRRNTGYALDALLEMEPLTPGGPPFNLAPFLCGSEGTLALTTAATVRLVPLPLRKVMVVAQFRTLREAMLATVEAVGWGPSAVELVDDPILQATKGNLEQRRNRFFLEGEPEAILVIQFEEDGGEPAGATEGGMPTARHPGNGAPGGSEDRDLTPEGLARGLANRLRELGLGYAHPVFTDPGEMARVWELRKAGLGLLMGLGQDSRSPSFMEDTAVRVADLPDYVEDIQRLLDAHGVRCVFYGHASVGELHLRPMIDLTRPGGVESMEAMAREVALLVRKYRGALSGEHGDGRARAPFLELALGTQMVAVLREVKVLWDPGNLLNPGKIVDPPPMGRDLRFSPSWRRPEVGTAFRWRDTGGFGGALEACNGAGVCRKLAESGGTMCPSYQVTREERDSTRGRANLFRQLFAGAPRDAFASEELEEALSLCLSCKACRSECPANVDMARMKAEFTHGRHRARGVPLADRFFGEPERLYPLAAGTAALTNGFVRSAPVRALLERTVGVDRRRSLPLFAARTFRSWYQDRGPRPRDARGDLLPLREAPRVALLVDLFTDHHEPAIARAALEVLERLGFRVEVPGVATLGRPQISRGLLGRASALCRENLEKLEPLAGAEVPLVGLEPSELLTLRDEYLDLCDDALLPAARRVADASSLLEEFLLRHLEAHPDAAARLNGEGRAVALHGHCHTKALVGNTPLLGVLERCGFRPRALATGCCGMAGSFGYATKGYDVSMAVGELVLFPAVRAMPDHEILCAPGFSCRHQIADGTGRRALHPAEILAGT